MQAIILAGGFGTRLKSVVADVPKPMALINGKPFLEYLLDNLNNQGFTKVVMAVGYKKESIMQYFNYHFKNISIVYSIEDKPLGTGGCVKKAMSYIDDDFVFVMNGDTMFNVDLKKMAKLKKISIACKKMINFDRYGEVIISNNKILAFNEKKYVNEGFINGGIYYMPTKIFDTFHLKDNFSIEKDFFESFTLQLDIHSFLSDDYFIDIGIPEDYSKAQIDFKKKKALFLDRDGIINIDFGHVFKKEKFVFTDFIFDLCLKYQSKEYLIIVVTNQAGIGKGLYSEQEFKILNNFMIDEFSKHGILISKVYYCSHKPADNCDCRKPKPGMFLQAIKDFNIDPKNSVAIGDKMSDLEAAHAAGIGQLYFRKTCYNEYPVDFSYTIL